MTKKTVLAILMCIGFSHQAFAQNILVHQFDSTMLDKYIIQNHVWKTYVTDVSNHLRSVQSQVRITTPDELEKLEKKAKSIDKMTNIIKILGIGGCGFGMYESFKSFDSGSNQDTDQAISEFAISDGITIAATLIGNRATNKAYDKVEVCKTKNMILDLAQKENPLRDLDEETMNHLILEIVSRRIMDAMDQGKVAKNRLNNYLYRLKNAGSVESRKINRDIGLLISGLTIDEFANLQRISDASENYRQSWKRARKSKSKMSDETFQYYRAFGQNSAN